MASQDKKVFDKYLKFLTYKVSGRILRFKFKKSLYKLTVKSLTPAIDD